MKEQRHLSLLDRTMVETAALSDAGNVRTLNEDSIAVVLDEASATDFRQTILVLADGLGGYDGGKVASDLVTARLPGLFRAGSAGNALSDLIGAVRGCNTAVRDAGIAENLQGMGTTVVAAVVIDHEVIFANVGDSRGYLFRNGSVIHRTPDHSLRVEVPAIPGVMGRNRFSHVLTRALGPQPTVDIDATAHRIAGNDVILLCSDGLTDCVDDNEIGDILLNHSAVDAARLLVSTSKERGGSDNISVIVARVHALPAITAGEEA